MRSPTTRLGTALPALVWLAAALPGLAAQEGASTLLVSTQLTHLSGGHEGVAGTVDWLQADGPTTWTVGLTGATLAGNPWATGRSEIALRLGPGRSVGVSLEAGGGRQGTTDFFLGKLGVFLWERLPWERLEAVVRTQALRVDGIGSVLVQPGLTLVVSPALLVNGAYGTTFGGELDSGHGIVQVTWLGSPLEVKVGGLLGRTILSPALEAVEAVDRLDSRWQGFAGVSFPFGGRTLGVVFDHMDAGAQGQTTVSLSVRSPLR